MRSSGSTFTWGKRAFSITFILHVPRTCVGYLTYPHLALPWAQIQIKTALKTLLDEAAISRHCSQAGELLWQEVKLPLNRFLLHPCQALGRQETGEKGSGNMAGAHAHLSAGPPPPQWAGTQEVDCKTQHGQARPAWVQAHASCGAPTQHSDPPGPTGHRS